ncbi:MAG: hypothetical protein ACI835_001447 [Planctomycetota bacterium]|jgi:hypothetical protein
MRSPIASRALKAHISRTIGRKQAFQLMRAAEVPAGGQIAAELATLRSPLALPSGGQNPARRALLLPKRANGSEALQPGIVSTTVFVSHPLAGRG